LSIHSRSTSKGRVHEVRLRGPDGREVSRTFRTKREATEYEASQRTAKTRGAWVDPRGANVTFAEVSGEWLKSNLAKRPSTRARDASALRVHVLPSLGHRRIGSLTPSDVRALVADWSARMAPRTVRRTYGALRAVVNYAVQNDLIGRSPCRGIKLPAIEPASVTILDPDDLVRLAHSMAGEFAPMVWLGAVLGLRWGEVAGLRVGRVDLLRRTITVAEQVTRGAGGVGFVSPPKSAAGRRTLSIPVELANLLSKHLSELGLTGATSNALLFAGSSGRPLDYSNWRRRVWVPAVERAGLGSLGFHDLRRTNATAMVLEGVDVKTAQARLGHSDPRLTLAVYAQATGEGDRSAAQKLGARLMTPAVDGKPLGGPTAVSQ
jgi:integrase